MFADEYTIELKAKLIGLAQFCPYSQDNPTDCQMHHLRMLPYPQRVEFIQKLSVADMVELIENHVRCLKRKEGRA